MQAPADGTTLSTCLPQGLRNTARRGNLGGGHGSRLTRTRPCSRCTRDSPREPLGTAVWTETLATPTIACVEFNDSGAGSGTGEGGLVASPHSSAPIRDSRGDDVMAVPVEIHLRFVVMCHSSQCAVAFVHLPYR